MTVFWPLRARPARPQLGPAAEFAELHRSPAPAAATARERGAPAASWTLYTAAALLGVLGVVLVAVDRTVASLAYLAPLIGVFTAVAAGVQQLDKHRIDRQEMRAQASRDIVRRFDERFANATKAATQADAEACAGAAVELLSFLREENHEFHQQTYYFLLSHLKVSPAPADPAVDQAYVRVFQRAAQLALPQIPPAERALAVDFTAARLSGVDLSGMELAEATLTGAVLRGANLSGACLWRARGARTDLSGACLRRANLEEVVLLDGLQATGTDFSFANLVATRFAPRGRPGRAVLREARFTGARLQGACFDGADLRDARFDGANLKGATFHDVWLNAATLRSIVRASNGSWRKARWDPDVWRTLKAMSAVAAPATPPRRKPSDRAIPHYRRHPFPGAPEHPSRLRVPM